MSESLPTSTSANGEAPVVEATGVSVSFPIRQGMFKPKLRLRAVQDVSITIQPRQAYGLVGESGSGKSTTGRALLRLLKIDSGTIRIGGRVVMNFAAPVGAGLRLQARERATQQGRTAIGGQVNGDAGHGQRMRSKTRLWPTLSTFLNPRSGRSRHARATVS